jgi:hypothetical protein
MALLDLVRRGPRNIRKRLFRDIIFIILVTVLAILLIGFFQGRFIKDYISGQLISETSLLAQKRFTSYLTPFDTSLKFLARIETIPDLEPGSTLPPEWFIHPLLEVHGDVGLVSIISEAGGYHEFSRSEAGDIQINSGKWTEEDPLR